MSRLVVINLGLPKTGTTTLSRALRRSGLRVADWRIREQQTTDASIRGALVGKIMYEDYFAFGDPLARLDEFDAVTEMNALRFDRNFWPQTDWGFLSAIKTNHPGAKFLLSRREPTRTADSMMRWRNLGNKRLPENDIPGLPRGYGGTQTELTRWIEGHYSFCRRVFADDPNFLEFDIEDPKVREKIGTFLGREMPWWGKSNTNKPMRNSETVG